MKRMGCAILTPMFHILILRSTSHPNRIYIGLWPC